MAPNPFASVCTINYDLIQQSQVSLTIRNPQGNLVKTLEDELHSPGYHRISWDGRNNSGAKLCGGVYQMQFTVSSLTGNTLYDKIVNLLINDSASTFEPVVCTTAGAYQISYKNYFQFGALIQVVNDLGYPTEDYFIPQDFTMYVKKPGYLTSTKHVSIADLGSNQQEDIVLQIAK
ncbi:MAG: FlgD immunoglobulin-like domain containing protein [Candidatus Cloacimonas sp.]|nr:FlgD immunoglobulin-like domain containing protein [Candidatus Cloacimonas sp.]